jgi:pimeloyl-ACP methyl ester carboxylesterase
MKITQNLLVLSMIGLSLAGCAHMKRRPDPQTLLLIQGVHLDGTSWNEMTKFFEPGVFRVMDIDRAGRDTDTPASLHAIALMGCRVIDGKAILVGHSYGGAIANEMAGVCPEKISKIIYLSAVVPLDGEKPFDGLPAGDQKNYAKAVDFRKPKIVPKSPSTFFAATDHQVDLNGKLPPLYSEWMSLTAEPIHFETGRFDVIPKAYIYTANDPVISIQTQRDYVIRSKIAVTESIPTGHFPMVSAPQALAAAIAKLATPHPL